MLELVWAMVVFAKKDSDVQLYSKGHYFELVIDNKLLTPTLRDKGLGKIEKVPPLASKRSSPAMRRGRCKQAVSHVLPVVTPEELDDDHSVSSQGN